MKDKVNIPKEDEKYAVHTGLPFGIDDKINSIDANKNGKSDVVEIGKAFDLLVPPLSCFAAHGGLDAVEEVLKPKLKPEALKALQDLKGAIARISAGV